MQQEIAAYCHGLKQVLHVFDKAAGIVARLLYRVSDDSRLGVAGRGQESDIFGEEDRRPAW